MIENGLFFIHGSLLLLFGAYLSGAFAGISFAIPKNRKLFLIICVVCGIFQMISYHLFEMPVVWKLYPLSTHLPLLLFLCAIYHKRWITSFASIFTAYLFCQPANWFGLLTLYITKSQTMEYLIRCCSLIIVAFIALRYLAPYFAKIYNKDNRSVAIFAMMPLIYYLFDYTTMIYTNLWINNNRIAAEFLPFFLGIIYMVFAILYCSENEEKQMAQHKAELIQIIAEQQKKEIETIKRNEKEIRILHHDMRLFLSSLAVCLEQEEVDKAKTMLASYTSHIANTRLQHFCNIDTINYVLSDFAAKCQCNGVNFIHKVELSELKIDSNMFASILSNSLDNALNAQKELDESSRRVKLLLKTANDKLLLSVENPISKKPVFKDGLPAVNKEGHGYGTQSICYMTERCNGKCQFTVQDHTFITKIIF